MNWPFFKPLPDKGKIEKKNLKKAGRKMTKDF